jgi:hypothetical protein
LREAGGGFSGDHPQTIDLSITIEPVSAIGGLHHPKRVRSSATEGSRRVSVDHPGEPSLRSMTRGHFAGNICRIPYAPGSARVAEIDGSSVPRDANRWWGDEWATLGLSNATQERLIEDDDE